MSRSVNIGRCCTAVSIPVPLGSSATAGRRLSAVISPPMATKAVPANKAVVCAACGWTNYAQAEHLLDTPWLVKWATPSTCGACGAPLERGQAAASDE